MEKAETNYMHVVPNSHRWETLEQLKNDIKRLLSVSKDKEYLEYLIIGLQNTEKDGYELRKVNTISGKIVYKKLQDCIIREKGRG